jgi:hypothetical protein
VSGPLGAVTRSSDRGDHQPTARATTVRAVVLGSGSSPMTRSRNSARHGFVAHPPEGSGFIPSVRDTAPTVVAGAVLRASCLVQGAQWTDCAMVFGVILTPGWAALPAWMP